MIFRFIERMIGEYIDIKIGNISKILNLYVKYTILTMALMNNVDRVHKGRHDGCHFPFIYASGGAVHKR